ncbi:MAG TPA: type II CAAX endopeptidase family protein [Terracidiphilus sp.]|nr:type II CAAX endopeptidase family protein [Terracidiphilus sp.]
MNDPEEEERQTGAGHQGEAENAFAAAPRVDGPRSDEAPAEAASDGSRPDEPVSAPSELGVAAFDAAGAPRAALPDFAALNSEPLLFQSFAQPPVREPVRIPNLGDIGLLIAIGLVAFVGTILVLILPMREHLFGWSLSAQANATNVSLIIASEAILYLLMFAISVVVFPLFWHEKFFKGLQWRGDVARKRFGWLAATSLACAGLAALDEWLLPGNPNAPIDKMFSTTVAAWIMFVFGTTLAPFFEEMFFRGFLLPALCTAWDWTVEKIAHKPAPPLDANGHPQWSLPAMEVGALLTSIPFALLHVQQQGHSLGPFLLLIVISMILCTVRLKNRSLAASTVVHACYNFIIFSVALIGTGGFRHFDKM